MLANQLVAIVLAAGKGTRMKSNKAKVLHEVMGVPMVHHVLHAISPLTPNRTLLIVGHQRQEVMQSVSGFDAECIFQEQQLGTGHAVLAAEATLAGEHATALILCGDTPLIRPETLQEMLAVHRDKGSAITLMTTMLDNPTNYGRVLRGTGGDITGIVEEKDATPEQRAIGEINAGIYLVDSVLLFQALHKVGSDNSQGEIYLTDIVTQAVAAGITVQGFTASSPGEVLGVNSRVELAEAHGQLQLRRNRSLMLQGVTILQPESTFVSSTTEIGTDTTLHFGVQIYGKSSIGKSCLIKTGAILDDCILDDYVTVGPYCCLTGCRVETGSVIAPFTVDHNPTHPKTSTTKR